MRNCYHKLLIPCRHELSIVSDDVVVVMLYFILPLLFFPLECTQTSIFDSSVPSNLHRLGEDLDFFFPLEIVTMLTFLFQISIDLFNRAWGGGYIYYFFFK